MGCGLWVGWRSSSENEKKKKRSVFIFFGLYKNFYTQPTTHNPQPLLKEDSFYLFISWRTLFNYLHWGNLVNKCRANKSNHIRNLQLKLLKL